MLWARDNSDTARQTMAQCMREVMRERLREQGVKAPDFRIAPLGSSVDTEKSRVSRIWMVRKRRTAKKQRQHVHMCSHGKEAWKVLHPYEFTQVRQ